MTERNSPCPVPNIPATRRTPPASAPTPWGVAETPGAWVTLTGTMLRCTATGAVCTVNMGVTPNYDWGYVDAAHPALGNDWDKFNIQHAILADGTAANLPYIDFIKVQTGVLRREGGFGEISTEINYADGLGTTTDFPDPTTDAARSAGALLPHSAPFGALPA